MLAINNRLIFKIPYYSLMDFTVFLYENLISGLKLKVDRNEMAYSTRAPRKV